MANLQGNEAKENRLLREQKQLEYRRDYTDPIKHYVRKNGWVSAAQERLRKVQDEGREYLTYFTLCAEKAIDVRLFGIQENLVEFDDRGYPGVVFCECDAGPYELIAANLGRTLGILAYFEDLVLDRDSDESKIFYSKLPFDVYNLDFTSVCFPRTDPPFSKTLEAIVTLIEVLGASPYPTGFDMFFTFRAQRSQENEEAIRALRDNLSDNRRQYDWFDKAFANRYGDVGQLLQRGYHEFLLQTLPKLIGRFGVRAGFRVACPYSLCYARPSAQCPDYYIISFGLSFDWEGEDTGIRRAVRQRVPKQEIITEAYLRMMQQIIGQDIMNVGTIRFARDQYEQDVQTLLALAEES
jgi:hypothetical protein